jgi:hypothetical protein
MRGRFRRAESPRDISNPEYLVPVAQNCGNAPSPVALRAPTSPRAAGRGEQTKSFSPRVFVAPELCKKHKRLVTTGLDPVVHADARLLKLIG